jgi:pyruvate dehydrogenase E1 component alpha subunit
MTPQAVHAPVADLAVRAASYAMPGVTVDGNDVLAVLAAAETAVRRARAGDGPTLIECKTYRVRGHFEGDPQRYKPADEQARWKERDPIRRFAAYVTGAGVAAPEALEAIGAEVETLIRDAVAFAEAAPLPDPAEVTAHVYAGGRS